ncbi:MAG: 4-alpha-glucanotransferase [Chloroflexi bacterium]|jgi:4-alpha-glucanotransferase|nr:4-alpha-glucanotransferase [Anaerolineaceae bacterium]NLI43912.1 4-alpha-glucanotransferase [Chloroflexota bacterium]HOE35563.1 4-alpha-glucanotransferase [Anaerolineaceae bacterium]HQL27018.1 4-alpha-glucanotransferase [Anaerolineaceae bacterium]
MQTNRYSGVLLHPTSFPGPDGIGDLGPEAYRWIDFLKGSGCQMWQILPLGPTGYGDSPYQCFSAFAGNPFLVSPLLLLEDGLLTLEDLKDRPKFPADRVDFGPAIIWKNTILDRAYRNFLLITRPSKLVDEFEAFRAEHKNWLEDYSLFMAIKESQNGQPWNLWPKELKFRNPDALKAFAQKYGPQIEKHQFSQFLFFRQWADLREYAHRQGIQIIGDIPFVIAQDSADLWANPKLFLLDSELNPTVVAGVPPDYFSADGQLWGNPLYDWPVHRASGYQWWKDRVSAVLGLVDKIRLDHFRGFAAAWHVPYGNLTARQGEWVKGPGIEFFDELQRAFPNLPIIAEDLGVITPDVEEMRDKFGLPGMKILQFAFSGDPEDDFLPHHYPVNCFAYTGSHDNNTAKGWYDQASPREQDFYRRYLNVSGDDIAWSMIRACWQSVARYVVAPMQDLLSLGAQARMNLPGSQSGNWSWRMLPDALTESLRKRLWEMNLLYSRLPAEEKKRYTEMLNANLEGTVKPH